MQLRSKLLVTALVAAGIAASNASAATVNYILDLSVDNAFTLLAETSAGDNAGLVFYDVPLTGNVLTLDHRAPLTVNLANFAPVGFNVLRTPAAGAATDPTGPLANPEIIGSQDAVSGPQANLIYGFGQAASSWVAKGISPAGFPDATSDVAWLDPLVLAVGTYDRAAGTLAFNSASPNLVGNVFATDGLRDSPAATISTQIIPFGGGSTNTPPTVVDTEINGYNANLPGEPQTLTHQFVATDADVPAQSFTWDQLSLLSYTENYDGVGPGPLLAPTFTPGGLFSWVSEGSPRGDYVWQVRATDSGEPAMSDLGTITVHVTGVPEPSTLALCGLAMVGAMGFVRRRNG